MHIIVVAKLVKKDASEDQWKAMMREQLRGESTR